MLASSGGSLIIYQAYDNLCAMTGRKAHFLKEKQIPSVWVFDDVFLALRWLLEEINMTWAHLEKKRTRLRTYTKSLEELCKQCMETASLASSDVAGDRVRIQRAEMTEQDVKALRARAEAAKQRAEALQISLRVAPNGYHRFAGVPSMPPKEQPLSQEDIKKLIDQRVADAIEAIATKQKPAWITTQWIGSYVRELRWEGDYDESSNQQTNKRYKMIRAYAVEPSNKKEYAGTLPLCNKCKFHHPGPYAAKMEIASELVTVGFSFHNHIH
uniref:Reverse transcriptase domain-containing protein n=1 Tax=Tanacetum cinerariifolium TaxID=118510 RepID=A0A6L2MGD4_TANCI|nr:hypothetical protein [Tanacetum cinerariifolium]